MANTTTSLNNINFMSESIYNAQGSLTDEELYAVAIGSILTTTSISKNDNAIGVKLGNGLIINSLVMASQNTTYTWKIPFTNANYIVVTTSCSGTGNFTRTTTTIACNDFHHGESSKPSNVMAIAIGY